MEKKYIPLIRDMSEALGTSGFEKEVNQVARKYLDGIGTVEETKLNNLIIRRKENKGNRLTVVIDGHSDELGFMISDIMPNGTLTMIPFGNWPAYGLCNHRVWVRTGSGKYILGVIAPKDASIASNFEVKSVNDCVIDVGARCREEAIQTYGIRRGEPVVPESKFIFDEEHGMMFGKAFDCRLGCATVIAALNELKGEELQVDVVGALTPQEEVGIRGALVASNLIQPDIAIAIESTSADDITSGKPEKHCCFHKGLMLRYTDKALIANYGLSRMILDLAQEKGIPLQDDVRDGGRTDGSVYAHEGRGVPTVVLSYAVRYIHEHTGIAAYEDFENGVKLLVEVLRNLNDEAYEKM